MIERRLNSGQLRLLLQRSECMAVTTESIAYRHTYYVCFAANGKQPCNHPRQTVMLGTTTASTLQPCKSAGAQQKQRLGGLSFCEALRALRH